MSKIISLAIRVVKFYLSLYVYMYVRLLRRGLPESRILAWYYVLNANISFTFQAIKNLFTHYTHLCFAPFCKFFGDF